MRSKSNLILEINRLLSSPLDHNGGYNQFQLEVDAKLSEPELFKLDITSSCQYFFCEDGHKHFVTCWKWHFQWEQGFEIYRGCRPVSTNFDGALNSFSPKVDITSCCSKPSIYNQSPDRTRFWIKVRYLGSWFLLFIIRRLG